MNALFVLVAVSIVIAGSFLLAFIWSIKTDQYEDRTGAAMRILHEDNLESTDLR